MRSPNGPNGLHGQDFNGTAGVEPFNRHAGRYDSWFETSRGRIIFASEVHCQRLVSDGLRRPWLEVGAGTGRFTRTLGVDIGVEPARAAASLAQRRGSQILLARGEALPFNDRTFGAVFIIVTLCFASDVSGLLREARRVVLPDGGVLVGIVPSTSDWARLYLKQKGAGHPFYSSARFFSLKELDQLALTAGLRFRRAVSTLLDGPTRPLLRLGSHREGAEEGAGFVSLLYQSESGRMKGPHTGGAS